jgi:RNA polymerase sigma-70 factor (ECF subfamily)
VIRDGREPVYAAMQALALGLGTQLFRRAPLRTVRSRAVPGPTGHSGFRMVRELDVGDAARLIDAIAARGDREAFATLFLFYGPRIKGMLMRSATPAETAEEIAQEAMLTVWRKAALFDPQRASVSTWIFTIARNLRVDRLRRERSLPPDRTHDVLDQEEPQTPAQVMESLERDSRVRAALEGLSQDQMTVIRLSFFEDKPHGEIARLLGIPLGTVKSRLRLAMTKMRQRLEELS